MRHTNSLIQPLHLPYTGKEKKGTHNVQVFKFAWLILAHYLEVCFHKNLVSTAQHKYPYMHLP